MGLGRGPAGQAMFMGLNEAQKSDWRETCLGRKACPEVVLVLAVRAPDLIPQTSKVWNGPHRPLSGCSEGRPAHGRDRAQGWLVTVLCWACAEFPSSATVRPWDPNPNI